MIADTRATITFLYNADPEEAKKESGRDLGAADCALGGALAATIGDDLPAQMQGWDADTARLFFDMTGQESAQTATAYASACFAGLFCSSGTACDDPGVEGDKARACAAYLRILGAFYSYGPLQTLLSYLAEKGKCLTPDTRLGDAPPIAFNPAPAPNCTIIRGVYETQPFIGPDGKCYQIYGAL